MTGPKPGGKDATAHGKKKNKEQLGGVESSVRQKRDQEKKKLNQGTRSQHSVRKRLISKKKRGEENIIRNNHEKNPGREKVSEIEANEGRVLG